jgi:hypothetical protein
MLCGAHGPRFRDGAFQPDGQHIMAAGAWNNKRITNAHPLLIEWSKARAAVIKAAAKGAPISNEELQRLAKAEQALDAMAKEA